MNVRLPRGLYSLFLLPFPLPFLMVYPPSRFFKVHKALSTVILSIVSIAEGAGVWRKDIWRKNVVERVEWRGRTSEWATRPAKARSE